MRQLRTRRKVALVLAQFCSRYYQLEDIEYSPANARMDPPRSCRKMEKGANWSFSGETGYHVKYNLGIYRERIHVNKS
jgi:hypothetical protein